MQTLFRRYLFVLELAIPEALLALVLGSCRPYTMQLNQVVQRNQREVFGLFQQQGKERKAL
jgi:hypothetical protein